VGKDKRGITDESLIEAAQGGDQLAFGQLVDRYKDVVFATVVAITRDFDSAHDIAQEAFLRAWFGLGKLKTGSSLPGWLRTIARNRALTWLERQRRRPQEENIDLTQIADSADSPEQNAEKAERRRLVETALDKLSEGSREVLVLHYLEELTTPEIAARLDISAAAVRQRLRRARLQMQEEMEEMVTEVLKDEAPGDEFTESVSELLERAQELFGRVEYRQAVPLLEQAREQSPTDTLVSLLLADAYTFARGAEDLEEDRGAYDRALVLLDEVLEREPDNTLARLRRAAVYSILAPEEEMLKEQHQIAKDAAGGPYEVVAELELARRYLTRGQRAAATEDARKMCECAQQALVLYKKLQTAHDWLACVLHFEQGVAYAMAQDGVKALKHFEQAARLTTPQAVWPYCRRRRSA
jgi:RNA polymerase sigma-70 factor (ECF subfamily)